MALETFDKLGIYANFTTEIHCKYAADIAALVK
jgi:hypothetical protein